MARSAKTTTIGGGAEYAKVAERLKLFREANPKGKQESAYEVDVDGTLVFTVWLWKDKNDLLELMKAGITDKDALRSSADANGNAKGTVAGGEKKDFEKLESIALGRALANLGYLASGEIASSEEMEEFEKYQKQLHEQAVAEAIENMNEAKTIDELKLAFVASKMMNDPEVVKAKDLRKAELEAGPPKVKKEVPSENPQS